MMVTFQTLGELSTRVGGVEVVDPGIPLVEYATGQAPFDALRKHPSVRKVTGFVARAVSTVPFHVYERLTDTDRERVTDHPLSRALTRPSDRVFQLRFFNNIMMDLLLFDRFLVVWTYKGDELVLTRVPARRATFIGDGLGVVEEIQVATSSGPKSVPLRQCIWDAGYSPTGAGGLSPMETLADLLTESREAVQYRRELWRQGARVSQVIQRPKDAPKWSDEAARRFRDDVAEFRKGGSKAGGWMTLEDGMELKAIDAFRPKDVQDLEGRKLTDADIAAAYWVPPELVGAREGTYSNIEAFRQMVYRDVAGPWIGALEQAFNAFLVPYVADGRPLYVEANIEARLRGSFEEQSRVLQASVGAPWLTRNEARARQNLPAVDGGDDLITPLNVLEGGQASPQDSAPNNVEGG